MPRCPYCGAINSGTGDCVRCGKNLGQTRKPDSQRLATDLSNKDSETIAPGPSDHEQIVATDPVMGRLPESPDPRAPALDHSRKELPRIPGDSALEHFSGDVPELISRDWAVTDQGEISVMGHIPDPSAVLAPPIPRRFGLRPALVGQVFMAEDRPAEPPDFDLFLWISRFFVLTLILGSVLFLFGHAYQRWGGLLILILFAGIFLLSRFAGGIVLLSILGFGRLLGSIFGRRHQQVPVRSCRIMDDQQREHIVRIKGQIVRGDIAPHDRVAIWGRWRQGTLLFRRGYNQRPRSWIHLEGSYTWILFLIMAFLNLWLLYELRQVYPDWLLWHYLPF